MTNKDERLRFTFRLPADLLMKLKNEADKQGVSLNALILQVIYNWLEKRNTKEDGVSND